MTSVREELEGTGQIDHFEVLRGKDKKYRKKRQRILTNTKKEAGEAADIVSGMPEAPNIIPFRIAKRKARRVRRQKEREEAAANAPLGMTTTSRCTTAGFRTCRRRRELSQVPSMPLSPTHPTQRIGFHAGMSWDNWPMNCSRTVDYSDTQRHSVLARGNGCPWQTSYIPVDNEHALEGRQQPSVSQRRVYRDDVASDSGVFKE